jgi:hypothetical protein
MFNNPFNSKFIADITKFLNEHRDDLDIMPCLNEKAIVAAEMVAEQAVLEERRNTLVSLFNEAVRECGCRGTTKEANDFAKAVQMHIEAKAAVVPAGKVTNPSHKANELMPPTKVQAATKNPKKKISTEEYDYELNEAFALPTEKELKKSIANLEKAMADKEGMKKAKVKPGDIKKKIDMLKAIHQFGKGWAKTTKTEETHKESVVFEKFDLFLDNLNEREFQEFSNLVQETIEEETI